MSSRQPLGKITQKTIASEANVSQTLVSLVLSGRAVDVAESTRVQILEAAKKLGYKMKKKASGAGRQRVLAYIRPLVERGHHQEHWVYDSLEHYYSLIQHHFLNSCLAHGYSLIVKDDGSASGLQHWLEEWDVDGVFWHNNNPELIQWIAPRYPTVQVNRHHVINADAVSLNQEESIIIPLDHLRQLGHERILVLALKYAADDTLRRYRHLAYEEYIETHRLPHWRQLAPPECIEQLASKDPTFLFERTEQALLKALELPADRRPTAVLSGDHEALVMMKRLMERGFSLPRDLCFVGIDNISASALVHPALTSLDNKLCDFAQKCVSTMMKRIQNPALPFVKTFITPELVVRSSSIPVEEMQRLSAGGTTRQPTPTLS